MLVRLSMVIRRGVAGGEDGLQDAWPVYCPSYTHLHPNRRARGRSLYIIWSAPCTCTRLPSRIPTGRGVISRPASLLHSEQQSTQEQETSANLRTRLEATHKHVGDGHGQGAGITDTQTHHAAQNSAHILRGGGACKQTDGGKGAHEY
jgi:hypothetical protein